MRIIAHLDMDCFFAQVEERENPNLKGKPVIVGADPKEGRGRGVVSTANYEARKFGLHSGMPISWAYRACPQAVYLHPRHNLYQQVSLNIKKLIEGILKTKTQDSKSKESPWSLEQVSIDEFYLDLSGQENINSVHKLCLDLKDKILQSEKLTCSIGLGPNKLIAKIASDFKKPDGLTIVSPDEVEKFLSPLPVETIPGIGPKTTQMLHIQGAKTVADLRQIPKEKLTSLFGKWGQGMWEKSQGIDERKVEEEVERKTLGAQTTFEHDTKNPYLLRRTLFDLCQKVWNHIQEENLTARMLEVTIRYFDFETHSRQKTLTKPLTALYQFRQEALNTISKLSIKKPIRLLGVRLGRFNDFHDS